MKKKIAILFGGVSAEHGVSIISGLQVLERIDKEKFEPLAIELTQQGFFQYYPKLVNRNKYLKIKPQNVNFGKDSKGVYFASDKFLKNKVYIDCAYLAFHGGNGESGPIQGLMETLNLPFTSPNTESSIIAMNKVLTKEVLESHDIKTIPWTRVFSEEIKDDVDKVVTNISSEVNLPVVIKPVHLGSSIGINIAKTKTDLKKFLLEASHIDTEILIEKFMVGFTEYNISVRKINDRIQTSEIERPVSNDEILSFADKYQRGGKKTGGMASLNRELPANISSLLADEINKIAVMAFKLIRAKGMVRIDFMVVGKSIYLTEINPIPGSMAYYLWEASGVSFTDQITDLIDQAFSDNEYKNSLILKYDSDIVQKFVTTKTDD